MLRPNTIRAGRAVPVVLLVLIGFALQAVAEGTLQFSQAEYSVSESHRSATIKEKGTKWNINIISKEAGDPRGEE